MVPPVPPPIQVLSPNQGTVHMSATYESGIIASIFTVFLGIGIGVFLYFKFKKDVEKQATLNKLVTQEATVVQSPLHM
jgi:H+/gluconate symporter-like permease